MLTVDGNLFPELTLTSSVAKDCCEVLTLKFDSFRICSSESIVVCLLLTLTYKGLLKGVTGCRHIFRIKGLYLGLAANRSTTPPVRLLANKYQTKTWYSGDTSVKGTCV